MLHVVVTGFIGLLEMHDRVYPNEACYNFCTLLPSSPLAYPTDSTTLLVTIKTLFARQQSARVNAYLPIKDL